MGLFVALAAGPANAQSDDQLKCQINASKVVAKFAKGKVKCLNKCWSTLRKGDPADCQVAADDGDARDATTQACIDAAETKSLEGQAKKCAGAACPNCYNSGNCPADAQGKTDSAENNVDTQDSNGNGTGGVHCNGAGVSDDEAKCQSSTAKTLSKFVGKLAKCTQKCKSNEAKGAALPGSCDPPADDPATVTCINDNTAKCVTGVDKKCGDVGITPACWDTAVNTGTEWCNLVKSIVNGQYTEFFCGSPNGAFLDVE
jgi:hypothetical protein